MLWRWIEIIGIVMFVGVLDTWQDTVGIEE